MFVSICWPTFLNSCCAICSKKSCRVFALPPSLPRAGKDRAGQGRRRGWGRVLLALQKQLKLVSVQINYIGLKLPTVIIFRFTNVHDQTTNISKLYAAYSDRFELATLEVCIKKLLKTSKFEIIVRRGGLLVGSVPSGSNSSLTKT